MQTIKKWLFGALGVVGCALALSAGNTVGGLYVPGEAIVQMRRDIPTTQATGYLKSYGLEVLRSYRTLSEDSGTSFHLVKGHSGTKALIRHLKKIPGVQAVSPNYIRQLSARPDDPDFSRQWALENSGQGGGIAGSDIKATQAWDLQKGSKDVVVAVFDTGVDYTHEDLANRMWLNREELYGEPGLDDDGNGYVDDVYGYDFAAQTGANGSTPDDSDPMDIYGHGTHIAGIIGAEGNNSKGISGVNWNVRIMALKVFAPDLQVRDSDALEAIDYVLKMKKRYGVNIVAVNASYGGYGGSQSDPMNQAIKELGDAGILFVAAAGNESSDNDGDFPSFPSSYDANNIIAVAASDKKDALADFSNHGSTRVDIAAPGVEIYSTVPSYHKPEGDIFSDDVEQSQNDWVATGEWNVTTSKHHSGFRSWTDSPDGYYPPNQESTLSYTRDIDLSGYRDERIGLGLCFISDLEEGVDFLKIEASADSGAHWTQLASVTGNTGNEWKCRGIPVPVSLKTGHFRMRFHLSTDADGSGDGVYIDDISIGALAASDSYETKSGTSMATPFVTGAVALMAAQYPQESAQIRRQRILQGAEKIATMQEQICSGGRLDLHRSLTLSDINGSICLAAGKSVGTESGYGGGCSYNPGNRSFDGIMMLMTLMALLYPLRRRRLNRRS